MYGTVQITGQLSSQSSRQSPYVYAEPFYFDGCIGYYHSAEGDTGILMCGAWGYEDLCARAAWASLAEQCAEIGFPTLRFDYPGAGNSLGDLTDKTLDDWVNAARNAAEQLKQASGVKKLVVIGFSIGCMVAYQTARSGLDVDAMILLAPIANGKRFIRETSLWASVLAAPPLSEQQACEKKANADINIAGFILPELFVKSVRAFDSLKPPYRKAPPVILGLRPDRNDESVAEALASIGADVETFAFDDYADIMISPTQTKKPEATIARVLATLQAKFPLEQCARAQKIGAIAPNPPPGRNALHGVDFTERALRFGEQSHLFGVLSAPKQTPPGAPILIMLNAGKNPHIGWRRMTVDYARSLAALGVSALRFDLGGIGESAVASDQPEQIVYSDFFIRDVSSAITTAKALGYGPVVLFGSCSGAYLALRAAVADERINAVVSLNPYRLVWDHKESVEDAIRFGGRPVSHAIARMTPALAYDILTGKLDVRPKIRNVARRIIGHFEERLLRLLGPLSPRPSRAGILRETLQKLRARGALLSLTYSEDDVGLRDFQYFFPRADQSPSLSDNIRFQILMNVDHDITARTADERIVSEIMKTLDLVVAKASKGRAESHENNTAVSLSEPSSA